MKTLSKVLMSSLYNSLYHHRVSTKSSLNQRKNKSTDIINLQELTVKNNIILSKVH